MICSRRYIAAGAWLLAAGLLVSIGGATAFADPGSDGPKNTESSADSAGVVSGGAEASQRATSTTTHGTVRRPESRVGSGRDDSGDEPTTGVTRSKTVHLGTRQSEVDAAKESDASSVDPVSEPETATEEDVPTSASTFSIDTAPTSAPTIVDVLPSLQSDLPIDDAAPAPSDSVRTGSGSDPGSDSGSDTGDGASPSTQPVTVADPAAPVTDPSATVAATESSLAPSTEPVVPPPADLAAFPDAELEALIGDNRNRAGHAPAVSPLEVLSSFAAGAEDPDQGPSLAGGSTDSLASEGTRQSHIHASSVIGSDSALEATPPGATDASAPPVTLSQTLQTFLESDYGRIVVAVSLSTMLAAALPGLIGLLIPAAAGVHIGYRQAKAGRALRASGIAYLARSGPLGVVRSGSLITLPRHDRRPRPRHSADQVRNVTDRARDAA